MAIEDEDVFVVITGQVQKSRVTVSGVITPGVNVEVLEKPLSRERNPRG